MASVVKRRDLIAALFAVCLGAGCGGGATPECQFNSDCSAGRYCDEGRCTADCADDVECESMLGEGAVCDSFGMCIAPPDGGPPGFPDAYVPPPVDSGPPPGDAGADAEADAPSVTEVCTRSTTGTVSMDEDGDGAIDEGCPWHFGRPHAVLPIAYASLSGLTGCFGTFLDDTGLRLYVACSATMGRTLVSERPSRAEPFGRPTEVAFADATLTTYEIVLEPGGLRGLVQATAPGMPTALWRAVRATPSDPFTTTPIPALMGTGEYHATMSADGLELFFVRGMVFRSTRSSLSEEFGAPTVVPGLSGSALSLSEDGHDLFFHAAPPGRGNTLFRAHRTDVTTAVFEAPEEIVELNPTGTDDLAHPHISLRTRELFFSAAGRAWAPTATRAIYRVQVCRDGPCVEPLIDCPASGRRSPDGFHCYRGVSVPDPRSWWLDAVQACASAGAHLVTISSEAERMMVFSAFGPVWLGATDATTEMTWRWDWPDRTTPEEPFLYPAGALPWNVGEPNDAMPGEDCLLNNGAGGLLNDGVCTSTAGAVCEDEVWPTW